MGHRESDLGGEVREGFLEETTFGLSSEGRLEKRVKGEGCGQREQHVQGPGGRRKLGGLWESCSHHVPSACLSCQEPGLQPVQLLGRNVRTWGSGFSQHPRPWSLSCSDFLSVHSGTPDSCTSLRT